MKSRKDKLSTLKVYLYIQNTVTAKHTRQSHYTEVAQGDVIMEQKMRFGLVLGWFAILKKMGADYEQLLRVVFSCLQGQIYFF